MGVLVQTTVNSDPVEFTCSEDDWKKIPPKRRTRSLKEGLEARQCERALRCYGTAAVLESSFSPESSEVDLLAAFLAASPPSSD